MNTEQTKRIADVAERVAWTFAQAFLAIWFAPVLAELFTDQATLSGVWAKVADTSIMDKAAVGGLAAAASLIKSTFAVWFSQTKTASTLPASLDPADSVTTHPTTDTL